MNVKGFTGPLTNRNFIFLLIGQTLSQFGDRLHQVALLWFTYQLTNSGEVVGLMATATALPYLLFGMIAGTIVDTLDKRKVMILADLLRGILITLLFILSCIKLVNLWYLVAITFLSSSIAQLFEPAKQSSVPLFIHSEELLNANSLLSSWQQGARLAAPVIGGLLMVTWPPYYLFLVDAITFFISALMIYYMNFDSKNKKSEKDHSIKGRLICSLLYMRKMPLLLLLLIMYAGVNLIFHGTSVVFPPILSEKILNKGSLGYGSMLTGYSFGMLLGAIAIKRIVTRFSILRIFSGAIFFGGISYMILGMTSLLIVAIICFVLCGFFFNIVSISFVTTIQQKVPISQQGSIFGLIGMIGMGVTPLSTLAASLLLLVIDIKSSFLLSGGLIALIGFVAFFNPLMKSKFVERGEVKAYD
ncbi:MFS transporter [Bacillus smithii]|uniref:MFS transporter n=1 Tax=Bacillus smithii TaxID=1479 RepID=UPI002E2468F7|nr:MFS transporter [Bacillus smithii]